MLEKLGRKGGGKKDEYNSGGSKILQRRVSNPSERGTGGPASKAPRGWGMRRGLCPLCRKFLYCLYQNGEFYAFPVIFIDTVTLKKGTLITMVGVRTPWTPSLDPPLYNFCLKL